MVSRIKPHALHKQTRYSHCSVEMTDCKLKVLSEHYKQLAPQYNKFLEVQSRAKANLIQQSIFLNKDDQLVDIGGGTAQVSLMIHSDLKMTNPVLCVDPSREMLDIANKNGAITIQSTAENFFAFKPDYPLKVVLMNACVHLFTNSDFVFSKLAEYMPEDGVCLATEHMANSLPMFKAGSQTWGGISAQLESFNKAIESNHLKCRVVSGTECGKINKEMWYEAIRSRFSTGLLKFSDEELEQGIQELEEHLMDEDSLSFEIGTRVFIITKK